MINSFRGKYHFLSNFYPCFDSTLEHYFQAYKTLDYKWQKTILHAPTPTIAKILGRRVKLRKDWSMVRFSIMESLVRDKFKYNRKLRDKLLATENEELVEGNWWGDTYWGVCNEKGTNCLGKILMKIRREYQNMEEKL